MFTGLAVDINARLDPAETLNHNNGENLMSLYPGGAAATCNPHF